MLPLKLGILSLLLRYGECGFRLIDEYGRAITSSYQEGLLIWRGGTVCDDSFSNISGSAICKEMGFTGLVRWRNGDFWYAQNSYLITLDDVQCSSPYWLSCSYTTSHNCGHHEDVFLTCLLDCPPGQYSFHTMCRECESNYYSAGRTELSCTSCPNNSTSSPGSSRCDCPAGRYWNGGNCTSCSSGTYKSIGMESCVRCPVGSTSTTGSGYCSCPAGKYWNEGTCHFCAGGSSSPEGALQCTRWHSSKSLEAIELVGLSVMAVVILVLGLLFFREKRNGSNSDEANGGLIITYDRDGAANAISGEEEDAGDGEGEFGTEDGEVRNLEVTQNMAFTDGDVCHVGKEGFSVSCKEANIYEIRGD